MTLFQIAKIDNKDLLIADLKSDKDLATKVADLMIAVARIPYICGRDNCNHPGCMEIRTAQDIVRTLTK